MERLRKILKILFVSLITAVILLIIASAILEPQVSKIFIEKARGSLTTRAEAGKINFSLLRNFPRAAIELKDLTIYSPGGEEDTLLLAGSLSVSLKIPALLRKQYIIDRLTLENAQLNIYETADGKNNLDIFKKKEQGDSSSVTVELRNLRITGSHLKYISLPGNIYTSLEITSAHNRLSFSPGNSTLELNGSLEIDSLAINNFILPPLPGKIKVAASLETDRNTIAFKSLTLEKDDLEVSSEGSFNRPGKTLALKFGIAPLSAEYILSLPGVVKGKSIDDYKISGIVKANGTIEGGWGKDNKPDIKASLGIEKGSFFIPGKNLYVRGISGKGSLALDPDNIARSFNLSLENFSANMAGSDLSISLSARDINNPMVDFKISGDIKSSTIVSLFDNPGFDASGIIRTNMRLYGRLPGLDKLGTKEIIGLNRYLNLNMRSVDFNLEEKGIRLEDIKGNIMIADNIWFDGITFNIEGSDVAMNGRLTGFNRWLGNNKEPVTITAGIWSNRFDFTLVNHIKERSAAAREGTRSEKRPAKVALNMDIKLDSLVIGNFRASMFSGAINYSDEFVNVSSFSLATLKGTLGGNAALARLSSGRYLGKGWFDIGKIDIHETFSVFNNFRQSYITDENLRGRLSGNLSITSELDSLFIPVSSTIVATGDYSISDGELLNFEPIMALSRFVELTELRDIRFSELKNDLNIRDRKITIPSMDINSSAFDIALSGNHSFEGKYDYHLKILLSDILSNKAIEKNRDFDEFGVIEPDGLGKTSLYLKIEGDSAGSKVSYDMKNMKVDIKKDIQEEKGTLKSILREEYGWYSNDTIPAPRKEETRKFRITWEEADSIKIDETVNDEKVLPLKNLFRKKKKGGEV